MAFKVRFIIEAPDNMQCEDLGGQLHYLFLSSYQRLAQQRFFPYIGPKLAITLKQAALRQWSEIPCLLKNHLTFQEHSKQTI